jgi:LysM repeat protein
MQLTRLNVVAAAAGAGMLAALTALSSCSLGASNATGPTSTIPSTAFRTIPLTPPKPTQPTTAAVATSTTRPVALQGNLDPKVRATYTVKRGDAPASIAAKYNVPLDALYELNGIDPNNPAVYVGQKILIPRILPPTTVTPTGEKAYVVRPNDSLLLIANKFGIPVQQILDLNGLELTSNIAPGQLIKIPG